MKAMLSRQRGGPACLELSECDDPVAGPGQVVISVRACGVNYPDVLIIEDRYQFKPERPFAPGGEVAGVVESVGEGVTAFRVGDRVIGQTGWGGMAEKIALDAKRCIGMPDAMPFEEAAAFILTYGTSYHALKQRAALRPGETLLVLGAAGGVGLAAVQLGKAMGAHVIAAASTQEKVDLAIAHGADSGLVYPRGPFDRDARKSLAALFKGAGPDIGIDVIYDAVGGDYAEASLRAMAWNGRFLVVGFPAGIPTISLNLPLLKGCQIIGVFWGTFTRNEPAENAENVRELFALYEADKIRPLVSASFPLASAGDAITQLAERRAMGKIVVTCHAPEA
jgi:NADPH2:quinone reductase